MDWQKFLWPSLVFLGVLLGVFILRFFLFKRLLRMAKKTKWSWNQIIVKNLKNYILFWGLFLGLYIALSFMSLPSSLLIVINKALLILFILSLAFCGSKIFINLLEEYLTQKSQVFIKVTLLEIFIKVLIFSIAFILVLHILNINIAPFITTLGIAGLAVGLALKDTLENFFSGLHILLARQIKAGDFIRLESGEEGFIEDINWRTTIIRTLANNVIIIPNAKLANSQILNYNLPQEELAILVPVGVSYKSDLEKVERVTIEVAKEIMQNLPEGVPEFEPFIRYNSFGDFSINFNVVLRAKRPEARFLVVHEFIKRLHKRYQEEGIEIPFPIRTLYLYPKRETEKQ